MSSSNKNFGGKLRAFSAALALSSVAVIGIGVAAAPAHAAEKKEKKAKPTKANYSKPFLEAYKPLEALTKADKPDEPALRAAVATMLATVTTEDDKLVAGGILNTVGADIGDSALQRKGIGMVLESGRYEADKEGVYNFAAGQLAYNDEDYAAARGFFLKAKEAGFDKADLVPIIAESSIQSNNFDEGFAFLKNAISEKAAAGAIPPKDWITRGLTSAYNAEKANDAVDFAVLLVRYYPDISNWRDAVNIQRNLVLYEGPEMLDLMRLAGTAGTLNIQRDYMEYVDAADIMRLPGEVKSVLERGIAAGHVSAKDLVITEAMRSASGRIAADKADLKNLEAQALTATSKVGISSSTADGYLGYGEAEKAEAIYKVALGKAGVDADRVNTRLGIAQVMQGKFTDAAANFAKVGGKRANIAKLWKAYAEVKANPPAVAAPVAAPAEPAKK